MDDKLIDLKKSSKKLVIDNKELYLRYDLNALVDLEEKYESLEKAFDFEATEGKLVTKLRYILHVGLKAVQPDMNEQAVGALFTMENMTKFQEAITEAVDASVPEGDKDKNPLSAGKETAGKEITDAAQPGEKSDTPT